MNNRLTAYRRELNQELYNILRYWQQYMTDNGDGGFYGALNNNNEVQPDSPKGGVLNSRILWTFAAAYRFDGNSAWLQTAGRAYDYLKTRLRDPQYGGIYWSVTADGQPLETRKQVYGQAFAIYALSEYYQCTKSKEVLDWAIELYHLLEDNSYDPVLGGYHDAFSREWQYIDDTRLSAKDDNAAKTMNTHLHILEAYTNLYRIWPDNGLRKQLYYLIKLFAEKIIDSNTQHQVLFFDTTWQPQSTVVSYGHDIEAAWLLLEAAEQLNDSELLQQVREIALALSDATIPGLESNGGLRYEYEPDKQHLNAEKHWWVQAEAMVGFFNAWEISGKEQYLGYSLHCWNFVKQYILDKKNGEWFWGVTAALEIMPGQDKAGFWKCPYHNSRACLELIHRLDKHITV